MFFSRRANAAQILGAVREKSAVVYSNNGNRALSVRQALRKARSLMPAIGVTRVAEISQLAANKYPVYQSTRPHVLYHTRCGQNTGAQGKGSTREQALISCLMETVENYCLEPRNEVLIRGSFETLRSHHVIADPKGFVHQLGAATAKHDEPLLWTRACSLELGREVLVPAEVVFCPFLSREADTRPIFSQGSNGVAAGSTYLEAVNHALFEVIERHYLAMHDAGKVKIAGLFEEESQNAALQDFIAHLGGEFELQLFALEIPGIKNLPMIKCALVGEDDVYLGFGCCAELDMAVNRAVSEALQALAVVASGSREDIHITRTVHRQIQRHVKGRYPEERSLHLKDYRKRIHNRKFVNLRSEYEFIMKWLHDFGCQNVFAANMTYDGMPVFVVKVLVPGLMNTMEARSECDISPIDIHRIKYFLT